MKFRKWLEMVATQAPPTAPPPPVDDDDDDDDDEEWSWDAVHRRFGVNIRHWAVESLCARKIKRILAEMTMRQEPKTDGPTVFSADESIEPSGEVEYRLRWVLPYDKFEDRLLATLRNPKQCDLWKALGVTMEQTWATLDRGSLFDYVKLAIADTLTGGDLIRMQDTSPSKYIQFDSEARKSILSLADKSFTLGKYAKFMANEELPAREQEAKDHVLDNYNMDRKHAKAMSVKFNDADIRVRDQMYGQALMVETTYQWDYRVET